MAAIYTTYSDELLSEFDYLSTWLPNTAIALGDIGRLRRDRFDRLTSLANLNVAFDVRERDSRIDLDYASAREVAINVNGRAEGAPLGAVRIDVHFAREHAVVFQARDCRTSEIADRHSLGEQIIAMLMRGAWPDGCVVVTEVVSAGPAVILVSSQRGAKFAVAGSLRDPTGHLPLASAAVGGEILTSAGIAVSIIAPDGLTPLYRVSGLRRRLLGATTFGHRGLDSARPEFDGDEMVFAEMTYADVGE